MQFPRGGAAGLPLADGSFCAISSAHMLFPQAYHVTFGTYLSRPPGSAKPHVDDDHNEYRAPLAPTDAKREERSRRIAKYEPVWISMEQRMTVDRAIREVAERYDWRIHAMAVNSDHVHVVITAAREGDALRDALKAVASRELNKLFEKRSWWAEGGSAKCLYENDYFRNAVEYVSKQNELPIPNK
jgi:REP element-mobilizing transposase RayT